MERPSCYCLSPWNENMIHNQLDHGSSRSGHSPGWPHMRTRILWPGFYDLPPMLCVHIYIQLCNGHVYMEDTQSCPFQCPTPKFPLQVCSFSSILFVSKWWSFISARNPWVLVDSPSRSLLSCNDGLLPIQSACFLSLLVSPLFPFIHSATMLVFPDPTFSHFYCYKNIPRLQAPPEVHLLI